MYLILLFYYVLEHTCYNILDFFYSIEPYCHTHRHITGQILEPELSKLSDTPNDLNAETCLFCLQILFHTEDKRTLRPLISSLYHRQAFRAYK